MTSRERFRQTMRLGTPDRVPLCDDGIRDDVLKLWRQQGLAPDADLHALFHLDRREEIMPDFEPHPKPAPWPSTPVGLEALRQALDPLDPTRLPADWPARLQALRCSDTVRMLRVQRGFFLSMGVGDWQRFHEAVCLVADQPDLVRQMLLIMGDFAARLADRILGEIEVDAAIFSEPIGGTDRPLLSPATYESVVLPGYAPILAVLARHGVETIIFRTYANVRPLLPAILKRGFNCLWVSEASHRDMDYRRLRREFGPGLRLIGGVSMDALRRDRRAIRREIERKVPRLLAQGGYVPLASGRVREDVPWANYVYYRQRLEQAARPA
jgi:hypothetical protein